MNSVADIDRAHGVLLKLLQVANWRAFKIWRLSLPLRVAGWLLIAAAMAGLIFTAFWGPKVGLLSLQGLVIAGLATVSGLIIGKSLVHVVRFRDTLKQIAAGLALCCLGWLIGGVHLLVFDKMYLRRGKVEALMGRPPEDRGPAA